MSKELVLNKRCNITAYRSPAIEVKIICIVSLFQEQHIQIDNLTRMIKTIIHMPLNISKYAKTEYAAKYFSVDPTFLTKRQGKDFQKGIHFFRPSGSKIIRWSIEALEEWMKAPSEMEKSDENILDKMFE